MCKVIGIFSLKGGVGKTSAVAALGHSIANLGKKVLLVDANFSAPNLGIHFNVVEPPATIHELLNRKIKLRDAIYELDDLDILPARIFSHTEIPYLALKNKINSLKKHYDVILIDSAPSLNKESLAPLIASDEILIMTTPDHSSVSMTLKSIKRAEQRGVRINCLVLNKVHNKKFELGLTNIEDATEIPVMAVIPHDINILKSAAKFQPSTLHKPNSRASNEYKKLAAVLIGEKYYNNNFMSLVRKITPSRQEINREIFYERIFE